MLYYLNCNDSTHWKKKAKNGFDIRFILSQDSGVLDHMKIAVITDTNSGMLPGDAEEHGIILQPMPVIIDGKEYREGENLDDDHFYQMLADGSVVHTSQPAAGDVIDLWKKVLKDYDEIVHIPMSSGLSGTCQSDGGQWHDRCGDQEPSRGNQSGIPHLYHGGYP